MPSAVARDRELADQGLVTVLMEAQGHKGDEVTDFVLGRWPQNGARICDGAFVPTPDFRGIPHAVLIGVDGTLVWDGSPLGDEKNMEQAIAQELEKVGKGWGDTAEGRKIRALVHGKRDLAGARKLLEALPDGDEKQVLLGEAELRFQAGVQEVKVRQADGRWSEAEDRCSALVKATKGLAQWGAEAAALQATFASAEGRKELAASKKLDRALKLLADGKLKDNGPKVFGDIAKANAGTAAGARAGKVATALSRNAGRRG